MQEVLDKPVADAAVAAPARPRRDVASLAVVTVLSICAMGSVLAATRRGVGLSPDSARYLSVATNMSDNRGIVDFAKVPLTIFPPGFPWIISFVQVLGVGWKAATIARYVNAASFGAIVWLGYLLLRRHVRSRAIALAGAAFIGVSAPLFFVSTMAWSEPTFIVVELCFLLALESALAKPHQLRWAVLAGGLVSLAFLIRYAGIALVPIGAVSLALLYRSARTSVVLKSLGTFLVCSAVAPAMWMHRDYTLTHTLLGPRNPSIATLSGTSKQLLVALGKFVLPDTNWTTLSPLPSTPKLVYAAGGLLVLTVAGVAIVALTVNRDKLVPARAGPGRFSLGPLLAFLVIYSVYIVYSELAASLDPIDARLLSPIAVPVIVVAGVGIDRFIQWQWRGRRLAIVGIAAVLLVLFANQLAVGALNVRYFNERQAQLGSSAFQQSGLGRSVILLPSNVSVITNNPQGLWLVTQRTPISYAPLEHAYQSNVTYPVSRRGIAQVTCTLTYLAWFSASAAGYYSPIQLSKYVALHLVRNTADGSLYQIGPLHGQRRCIRPAR